MPSIGPEPAPEEGTKQASPAGDLRRAGRHPAPMAGKRPPEIDAEYRVLRGPWPRWALQLGLVKLALRTAGVVVALMAMAGLALLALGWAS